MDATGFDTLLEWAAELVRPLLAACERDERIVGLTLNGSAATGRSTSSRTSTSSSSVATTRGRAVAERNGVRGSLGPSFPRSPASTSGNQTVDLLFGPPLRHVDLKFVSLTLSRSRRGRVVLFERDGVVSAHTAAPRSLARRRSAVDRGPVLDLGALRATRIGRGELFECAGGFAFLRQVVFGPLLAVAHGRRAQGMRDASRSSRPTRCRRWLEPWLRPSHRVALRRSARRSRSTASCARPQAATSSAATRPRPRASRTSTRSPPASPEPAATLEEQAAAGNGATPEGDAEAAAPPEAASDAANGAAADAS